MFNNELYRELIGLNLLNDVMKERLFEVMTEFAEKGASIYHVHKSAAQVIIFYNRQSMWVYQAIVIDIEVHRCYFDLRTWTHRSIYDRIITDNDVTRTRLAYVPHRKIQYPTAKVLLSECKRVFGENSNESIYLAGLPLYLPPLTEFLEVEGLKIYCMGRVLVKRLAACINSNTREFYYALIDGHIDNLRIERLSKDAFHSLIKGHSL